MAKKNSAAKVESVNFVSITKSSELKTNVGQTVQTPNGSTFKVVSWETATEHNENTPTTAYGSKLVIERNGKKETYYNNPSGKQAGKLTNFYLSVSIEKSGQGGDGDKKRKFSPCSNIDKASKSQLQEEIKRLQRQLAVTEEREKAEQEEKELATLLQGIDRKSLLEFLKKSK